MVLIKNKKSILIIFGIVLLVTLFVSWRYSKYEDIEMVSFLNDSKNTVNGIYVNNATKKIEFSIPFTEEYVFDDIQVFYTDNSSKVKEEITDKGDVEKSKKTIRWTYNDPKGFNNGEIVYFYVGKMRNRTKIKLRTDQLLHNIDTLLFSS